MKSLGELAEIRTGYPFRGRIDREEDGNCLLVQMGDVRAGVAEVTDVQARVSLPEGPGKHSLKLGTFYLLAGVRVMMRLRSPVWLAM